MDDENLMAWEIILGMTALLIEYFDYVVRTLPISSS